MAFPSPTKTVHNSTYPALDTRLPTLSSAGKNILITGGGSGIGSEIAKAFAQSGAASIAVLGRTEASLLQTKQEIEALYPTTKVSSYVADISNIAALEHSIGSHCQAHGPFHVLVANAGYLPSNSTLLNRSSSTSDDWFKGFEVNVKGNFNLVRAFLPHAVKSAVVLSTTSAVAHMPFVPGMSSYAASKLAAAKVFEYLHHEHPDLFVLSVHPGTIRTAMSDKALDGAVVPYDDVDLPASFMVWAASEEAKFLNGKSVWAQWDVDELKAEASTTASTNRFTLGVLSQ